MKMLSVSPVDVGVYSGETETNLDDLVRVKRCASTGLERRLLIKDGPKKFKAGFDLGLRVLGLNDRANDCNIHILCTNVVGG